MAQEVGVGCLIVDINDTWVKSMRKKLEATSSDLPSQAPPTIFRVPPNIRQGDPRAFDPQIISIGPYHHDESGLKAMEKYKWCYLRDLLARSPNISFEDCLEEIKSMEAQARGCYSDEIRLESEQYTEMLLLDACFMIEIFKKQNEEAREDDPIQMMPWILPLVREDLLLLENQLPFFVLQRLFDLIFQHTSSSLIEIAVNFYSYLFITKESGIPLTKDNSFCHLLHLLHTQLSPPYQVPNPSTSNSPGCLPFWHSYAHPGPHDVPSAGEIASQPPRSIPSATELQVAGVRFKKNEAATTFLHVNFDKGIMEIPPIYISYSTNSLMRNFIAFEQLNPRSESCFTSYAILMDRIINTRSDVAILYQDKILDHGLGSDKEVALLFNNLGKGVGINVGQSDLSTMFQDVNKYCDDDGVGCLIVDINDTWVKTMRKKLEATSSDLPSQAPPSIFRVPPSIRQGDPRAFDPQIISIGPYHHDESGLKAMEKYKWCYLRDLLARSPNISFEDCLEEIKSMEAQARGCYSDEIRLESEQYTEMLLLDACFMIEIFKKQNEEAREDDPIQMMPWILPLVREDLLLLENQLPFFVLQRLFDLIFQHTSSSLIEIAVNFYSHLFITKENGIPLKKANSFCHLLHLLHTQLSPPYQVSNPSTSNSPGCIPFWHSYAHPGPQPDEIPAEIPPQPPRSIPSATELQVAGVRFKKNEAATTFLHVNFHKGIMEIPPVYISYSTNSLMRNFIAFEQLNPRSESCFTSYAILMDRIINTRSDVAILYQDKILDHGLGSDKEVALLFNNLGKGVGINVGQSDLSTMFQDVNKYCDDGWHTSRAYLVRNYFSNPWSAISLGAGIVAFVLTTVMTFFVIYTYYRPNTKPSFTSGLALFSN